MLENQAFDSARPGGLEQNQHPQGVHRPALPRPHQNAPQPGRRYARALEGDLCSVYPVDNNNKLIAFRRWKSAATNQAAVVVANFANATRNNYTLAFPSAGTWYVHFNSDSTTITVPISAMAAAPPSSPPATRPRRRSPSRRIARLHLLASVLFPPQLAITRSNSASSPFRGRTTSPALRWIPPRRSPAQSRLTPVPTAPSIRYQRHQPLQSLTRPPPPPPSIASREP